MKLHSLKIEGFRKHLDTEIIFSDSTFLIGENNVGKSSVLYALEYLLCANNSIPADELRTAFNNKGLRELRYPTFTGLYLKVCEN